MSQYIIELRERQSIEVGNPHLMLRCDRRCDIVKAQRIHRVGGGEGIG